MLTRIKQWLCSHRYDLADLSDRDKDGMVSCRCHKCGAVHRATHGLALPGSFDRNTPIYIAPAALTVTGLMNLVRDYADAFAGVDMKDALVKYEVVRDYATRLAGPAGNDGVQTTDAPERVQLPEKARAGIEVLRDVVEKLLTTSRYVDEEGEATLALADMAACIADPPFKLNDASGVDMAKDEGKQP